MILAKSVRGLIVRIALSLLTRVLHLDTQPNVCYKMTDPEHGTERIPASTEAECVWGSAVRIALLALACTSCRHTREALQFWWESIVCLGRQGGRKPLTGATQIREHAWHTTNSVTCIRHNRSESILRGTQQFRACIGLRQAQERAVEFACFGRFQCRLHQESAHDRLSHPLSIVHLLLVHHL
jgi:hypothetical protein